VRYNHSSNTRKPFVIAQPGAAAIATKALHRGKRNSSKTKGGSKGLKRNYDDVDLDFLDRGISRATSADTLAFLDEFDADKEGISRHDIKRVRLGHKIFYLLDVY
jgi:hypothetical protein